MDPGDGTSPHHRFSQRGYKSSSKNDAAIKNTSTNESKVGRPLIDALTRTVRFGRTVTPTYRNLYTASSLQEYLRVQENTQWENVEDVIIRLFQNKQLAVRQLTSLRESVKELWNTIRVGPLLFDFYLKKALKNGVSEIRKRLANLKDMELIQATENNWIHFFSETLPTLQAIFFPMKTKQAPMRHTILICFRDGVLLKINLKEALESLNCAPPPGIKHMLLIIQSIHDTYPPNENYLALEQLVAMVVSPYMGFRGIYEGNEEPSIRSKEPELNRWKYKQIRRSSPLRWPISNPIRTLDTLEEMFQNVYSKENDSE